MKPINKSEDSGGGNGKVQDEWPPSVEARLACVHLQNTGARWGKLSSATGWYQIMEG